MTHLLLPVAGSSHAGKVCLVVEWENGIRSDRDKCNMTLRVFLLPEYVGSRFVFFASWLSLHINQRLVPPGYTVFFS